MARRGNIKQVSLASSLPSFNGDEGENLNFFLDQINNVAALENWSEARKFLVLKLNCKGRALSFIANDPIASRADSFVALQGILKTKFNKTKNFAELQQEFSHISQKPNQSVKDLAAQIDNAANAYLGIDHAADINLLDLGRKIKLNKLYEALRSDIRVEVKKLNPQNFDEATKAAINIENALADPAYNANNLISSDISELVSSQIQTNAKILELSEKIDNLSISRTVNNVQFQDSTNFPGNNDFQVKCLICAKNHLTINCWHFPKIKNANFNASRGKSYNKINKQYRENSKRGPFKGRYRGNLNQ